MNEAADVPADLVVAINALTARWCASLEDDGSGFVVSGAGAWPVLALLASGATGEAAAELAGALGRRPGAAIADLQEVIAALRGGDGTAAALGLWVRDSVAVRPEWSSGLPPDVIGRLGDDHQDLDAWCARQTGGLIERLPVAVDRETLIVLASAVLVRTRWQVPFREAGHAPDSGPWANEYRPYLVRDSQMLAEVAASEDGEFTRAVITGDNDVDVHLLIGEPSASPADVIGAGLSGSRKWIPGDRVDPSHRAPALTVESSRWGPEHDLLMVGVMPFNMRSTHDLLHTPEVFGLRHASTIGDHFPSISAQPLAVQQAGQEVIAGFDAEGFEGAAVTAVAAMAGSGVLETGRKFKRAYVNFDRPFGFLAVQRITGLVVLAGWVAEAPAGEPGMLW